MGREMRGKKGWKTAIAFWLLSAFVTSERPQ